jgi:hypothetical protein
MQVLNFVVLRNLYNYRDHSGEAGAGKKNLLPGL